MASNTQILIKRSGLGGTAKPTALSAGELAYAYSSNTLFIGSPTGDGVVNVAGVFYTSQVDNATSSNTASTLVKRNADGQFSGRLDGIAGKADQLTNSRDFSIDGDDVESSIVSFDGTGNVVLQGNLKTTGVSAGTYGGATNIPVITVDDRGRLSFAANVSVATTLTVDSDSGNAAIDLLTDTLTLAGGAGITSSASGDTITFDVDNTVVRSNTPVTLQTIDGAIEISGNLTVLGTQTTINTQTLNIADPIIYLAANNYSSDIVDIGYVGNYYDGSTQRHAGVFRNAGNKEFYVFDNYDKEPNDNDIDVADASFRVANLHANLISQYSQVESLQSTTITSSTGTVTVDDNLTITGTANFSGGISLGNGDITANSVTSNTILVNDTLVVTNGITSTNGDITSGGKVLASQGSGTTGGFSFTGTEGGNDSGMFSNADGNVHFFADNTDIAYFTPSKFEISKPTYLTGLNKAATLNVVYFNAETGEITYDVDNSLTPTSIANGAYSLSISSTDGLLTTNGAGLQLTNGAIIKDTSGDAVAFGQNAGTLSQGQQAVAIGDSAGYNTQGAFGVAIGYGAGNVSQGQQAVAIGINAGISNQGTYGVAIGSSSGSNQGSGAVAIGYDSGNGSSSDTVAIGTQAAKGNTSGIGANSIAIGNKAAFESAAASSIVLNASGNDLSPATAGFFVNPVRYSTSTAESTDLGLALYNQSTKEFKYTYALDGGSF